MIILRDKNFAKVEKTGDIIRNEAEGICMEIIKTCRMYHSGDNNTGVGDQNIDHWLREEMENRYFKDIINSKAKDTTIVYAFLRNEDRNNLISRNERPANIIKDLTVSFGDEFIVDCIKKAERGGKYTKYLEGNKLHMNKEEIENYKRLFKYIALSISGQINPRVVSFWERDVDNKRVDYRKSIDNKTKARQIIATCIYEYLVSMGIPEEEISPTLINLGL